MVVNARYSPANLVTDYWLGKSDFLVTIVLGLLGLRAILALLQEYLPSNVPLLVISFWAFINAIIFIWQIVGATRKTRFTQDNSNDPMLVWCGWAALLVTCVVTLFQGLDLATKSSPTREQILLANYTRPTLPVSEDGTIAYIRGDLDYNSNTGLLNALGDFPNLKTIILESEGGLVFAARALARNIIKNDLDTRVETICSSSCTIVFAAGKNRALANDGKIGFHQYALLTKYHTNTLDLEQELARDRRYFSSRGFTPEFIARIFNAPPDKMWHPDRDELLSGNVISE